MRHVASSFCLGFFSFCLDVFGEPVQSLSWNFLGSQLVVSTKDKKLHIVDPRAAASPLVASVDRYGGIV